MAAEKLYKNPFDEYDFEYLEDDEGMPLVSVDDQNQAESHLRALDHWRYEAELIEDHANAQIRRANEWKEEELAKLNKRIQYHESGLIAYLQTQGKKTIKLINGTIKRIAGRDRVEVKDLGALMNWNDREGGNLIRIKYEPDKVAIKEHISSNGELPEGVDLVKGDDTFKVDTNQKPGKPN